MDFGGFGRAPSFAECLALRAGGKVSSIILDEFLKDKTSGRNILWGRGGCARQGPHFAPEEEMTVGALFGGGNGCAIRPRSQKGPQEKRRRAREMAEVFTPAWVCNKQNNLIDGAWFGGEPPFNEENADGTWKAREGKIGFGGTGGKTWKDYVRARRLEIACGEAPYIASRYDSASGFPIPVRERIGILDRKLRATSENAEGKAEWLLWAGQALKSVYGYDFQGDNVFLARLNLLLDTAEAYEEKFGSKIEKEVLVDFAEIIAWNIWQMDGLKLVIPYSCGNKEILETDLFGERVISAPCEGCTSGDASAHNGAYCRVMDWERKEAVRFASLAQGQ